MRKEYLLEENAMLQRMLLQEQREKLSLQQELHSERVKCAMLEQEIAQAAVAAQEMGDNLAQYFNSRSSDTNTGCDQTSGRTPMGPASNPQGAFSSPFAPEPMQLQCIPEHVQKQQEMLEFAEQVRDFAANLQQRLATASAANTPKAAAAAAAAGGAGPFSDFMGAAHDKHRDDANRAHSTSVQSELPGSMDLPMQALAVSRLALQLHQPGGPEEEASFFSSSGRKSSCTVLGASVDLTSSMSSFPSYGNSQQSAATAQGMLEPLLSASEPDVACSRQSQSMRSAIMRSSVTRGAAAIAGSCASIAAAAAATAAAAAAKKAAAAAAMADASFAQCADLRASTESGSSSIRSPGVRSGSLSASIKQRRQWQQAQETWALQASQANSSRWGFAPDDLATTTSGNTGQQAPPEPSPTASSAAAGSAQQASGASSGVRPWLPGVPAHLMSSHHTEHANIQQSQQHIQQRSQQQPHQQQQHQQQQLVQAPQQQACRYGSDKLSELTSPLSASTMSPPISAQSSGALVGSRPPMYPQQARPSAQLQSVGPLHRNLASLGSSQTSFKALTTGEQG